LGWIQTEEVNQEDHNRNWGGEPIGHWSTNHAPAVCVCLRIEINTKTSLQIRTDCPFFLH
jgi:hypothetical protein